jgi:hypothetical protein
VAVPDVVFVAPPHHHLSAPVDGGDVVDHVPGLAAVTAGVHRERTAHGSGHTGEELGAFEVVHRGEARHLRAGDAGFRVDPAIAQLRPARGGVHQDRGAAPAAVAHQQVRTQADEQQRLVVRKLAQEFP